MGNNQPSAKTAMNLSVPTPTAPETAPSEIPPVLERTWTTISQSEHAFSFMSYNILAPVQYLFNLIYLIL